MCYRASPAPVTAMEGTRGEGQREAYMHKLLQQVGLAELTLYDLGL